MVRRRPWAPEAPSTGGRTAVDSATGRLSRLRPGPGRKEYQASANLRGSLETWRPRHSLTLPTTTHSPVCTCCHSSATCPQSSASRNLRSTPELAPPSVLRWPGSITEKISFSSTDLPPPFSRNSTPAGAGRRGGPVGSSSKNSACVGAGSGTGSPTPRRSSTVSA